ncbi:MAG: 2-oxoacid:acceptor oxidoreductase family protein [Patescibacteria group bacterium]
MNQDKYKIVIAGEGGQGGQTIAKILLEAAYRKKMEVSYIPNFGVEQRGGVSVAFVLLSKEEPIVYPKFDKGDIVVILSERSVKRTLRYVDKKTTVIYNSTFIKNSKPIKKAAKTVIGIDATTIAKEQLSPRVFNTIILGSIAAQLQVITLKQIQSAVKTTLGHKFKQKPKLEQLNLQAVELGYDLVTKNKK